jgi:ubiquinone/menaquinone biosynthesis C-methylase UbiE
MDNKDKLKEHYSLSKKESLINGDLNSKTYLPFDGFHTRGREALLELINMADINKDMKVLDIGCGTGGSSKLISKEFKAKVFGLDFSLDYLLVGSKISRSLNSAPKISFINGEGCFLPFKENSFDIVITEHVQMNIKDKSLFYSEIKRVLKPGGAYLFHEVFFGKNRDVKYPLPWAKNDLISFLVTKESAKDLISDSGLTIDSWDNKDEKSYNFFNKVLKNLNLSIKNDLGLSRIMGDDYGEKIKNMAKNLDESKISIIMGKAVK